MKKSKMKAGRMISFVLVTILFIGITTATICAVAGAVYVKAYISPTIDINLDDFRLNFTSFVYYIDSETGEEVKLEELHGTENRIWVDYEHIPTNLVNAYIAIEDAKFEKHNGVDWKRTIGAGLNFIVKIRDNFGGGSTITQQLIKNITGEDETSVKRKLQEVMRALELERKYEKDDIMEMYLNTIYLGQSANGVKTAAMAYFGKDLSELTIAECAALAGIAKNPYKYDVIRFPEFNKERRDVVLKEMKEQGKITEEEYNTALAEEVSTENGTKNQNIDKKQSYFVDEVIMSVRDDLIEEKGYSKELASRLIYTGGLKIIATIDPKVQEAMDQVFLDEKNLPGVVGKDGKMPQAAMIISDPYTGEVKAMYGGRGEKEGMLVLNRATRSKRSPGSAIKPLTVYAPALEYGVITPASAYDDVPKSFEIRETGYPKNYYNYYRGRTNIVKAVEISNNPIPVEILEIMGTDKAFTFANVNLGLSSLVERREITKNGKTTVVSDINLAPLAMGGLTDGVSVIEMAGAYSAFTNNGKYNEPVVYSKVYDSKGNILLDNSPNTTVAMSEKTATYMLELLKNVVTGTEGTGKQAAIPGMEVGAKTGTTNSDYDRWFVGITPYYTGVCWFGYDAPQAVKGVSANPALSIWKRVMTTVHKDLENKKFNQTVELKAYNTCRDSGGLPTSWCAADIRGSRVTSVKLAPEDAPTETCKLHKGVEIDKSTGGISNNFCPESQLGSVGVLDLDRQFARSGVSVSDQRYVLYSRPENNMYAPSGSFPVCSVHGPNNDGNKPPEPEVPEEPETGENEPGTGTTPDPAPSPSPSPDPEPKPDDEFEPSVPAA